MGLLPVEKEFILHNSSTGLISNSPFRYPCPIGYFPTKAHLPIRLLSVCSDTPVYVAHPRYASLDTLCILVDGSLALRGFRFRYRVVFDAQA